MRALYDFYKGVTGKYSRSKYGCTTCNDKGFVRINGTDRVVPCPKCNEDGTDGISG